MTHISLAVPEIGSSLLAAMGRLGLGDHNTRVVVFASVLLGLASGGVGVFTLLRRRALIGDALSHAMLPGIGVAFLIGSTFGDFGKNLLLLLTGALASGLLGVFTILGIRRWSRTQEDAALGIVLSVFFGLGLVLLGLVQQIGGGHAAGLESFIYGKTASITIRDAFWIAAISVPALALVLVLMKEWSLVCFDEVQARVGGLPIGMVDVVMMGAVVAVLVVGLQAVGVILMIALLVIPAAAARFWTQRVSTMVLISALIGGLSGMVGSLVSAVAEDWPSGATIVLVAASIFGFSLFAGTRRGLFARYRERQSARRQAIGEVNA
ncbi:MAG: metal ABC transporter permease [Planctomycetaceae bacterium]|nr:MAG: metal ABC transporter permease [Planctomycetaceae bacterium]